MLAKLLTTRGGGYLEQNNRDCENRGQCHDQCKCLNCRIFTKNRITKHIVSPVKINRVCKEV